MGCFDEDGEVVESTPGGSGWRPHEPALQFHEGIDRTQIPNVAPDRGREGIDRGREGIFQDLAQSH
jgi:hypothetical protein